MPSSRRVICRGGRRIRTSMCTSRCSTWRPMLSVLRSSGRSRSSARSSATGTASSRGAAGTHGRRISTTSFLTCHPMKADHRARRTRRTSHPCAGDITGPRPRSDGATNAPTDGSYAWTSPQPEALPRPRLRHPGPRRRTEPSPRPGVVLGTVGSARQQSPTHSGMIRTSVAGLVGSLQGRTRPATLVGAGRLWCCFAAKESPMTAAQVSRHRDALPARGLLRRRSPRGNRFPVGELISGQPYSDVRRRPGHAALHRRRVHGRRRRPTAEVGVLGHGEPDRAPGDRRRQHRGVDGLRNRRRARRPHARVHLRPRRNWQK